jgi:hypothetical protein
MKFTSQQEKMLIEKVVAKITTKYDIDREFALCGGFHDKMLYDATDILKRIGVSPEAIEFAQMEFYDDY